MIAVWITLLGSGILVAEESGQWRSTVADCFNKAHDYSAVVRFLETHLETLPEKQQSTATLLLCYAYKQLGNSVGEEKWLAYYFRLYESAEPDFDFLPRSDQVKLYEYLGGWKRMYPGLHSVAVHPDSKRVPYFTPPAALTFIIDSRAPCGLEIIAGGLNRETLYSGYLEQGRNTVGLTLLPGIKQNTETKLEMILRSGAIQLKFPLILSASFQFPANVTFDPQTGTIVIKGEAFKPEQTVETVVEYRKYFDKKFFLKKAVPYLAIGGGLLAVDRLAIYPAIHRESSSPGSRAFMNGLDKTCLVMGAGVSFKGVLQLIRSFKTEKNTRKRFVAHPEAADYNKELRSRIVEAEKAIFVLFDIRETRK